MMGTVKAAEADVQALQAAIRQAITRSIAGASGAPAAVRAEVLRRAGLASAPDGGTP